jgi:HK97 family phage major capsid protein
LEITEDEKKALLTEFIEKAKTALALEAKADITKINTLISDQRTKYDEFLAGKMTESDFKTFEAKSLDTEKKLQTRVDEIETKMARPPIETPEALKTEVKPGQLEYKAAWMKYMRSARGGELSLDDAAEKYDMERKALVSNTAGQILLPEELESEIYRALPNLNIIRGFAAQRTIIRERILRRSMTEVTMGWGKLELGDEPDETEVTPSKAYQYPEDLEGLARIGKDELADTDVALEALFVDSFGRARARMEETGFVNGTGHSNRQPEGMLDGSTITRVTGATADVIVVDDFLDLIYAVPAQYRRNGKLMVPSTTELAMRKLKSAGSEKLYLWQPNVQAGQPSTFAGYPVHAQEDIPAIGSSDECDIAIFGDIQAGYRIIDRQGMTIQRLFELWAIAGLVGLLASARVTGGVIRADAIRVLKEAA